MSMAKYKLHEGRLLIPEEMLERLDLNNLYVVESSIELRKKGFKYFDFGFGYEKLKFLLLTDEPPKGRGVREQVVASRMFPANIRKKGNSYRLALSKELRNYAGIEECCVLVRVEGKNPYIGMWSEKNWRKYMKLVENQPL